jgi:hypothetical protein
MKDSRIAKLALVQRSTIVRRPDALTARRNKLVARLTEQRALAASIVDGVPFAATRKRRVKDEATGAVSMVEAPRRVAPWFFPDVSGQWFVELRYGAKPLPIAKNADAVQVSSKQELVATIDALIAAVSQGELDAAINQAGARSIDKKRPAAAKPA